MKSFKFRLQPVLDLRQHAEKEQKDELARERHRLDELNAMDARLRGELSDWSAKYIELASEGITPAKAVQIDSYIRELERLIEENGRRINEQTQVVEKARLRLIERMKDRKTLETLHDKQFSRYVSAEQHRQEKEVEESISARLPERG